MAGEVKLENPGTPESGRGYVPLMEVRVLGPVEVWINGQSALLGGPKQRALLGLLVAAAPAVASADVLVDGLWGEDSSSGSRSTLQTYVSNLRQVLGDVVVHDRGGYRLAVTEEAIDARVFERALEGARSRIATDPSSVALDLRRALASWRGRAYADLGDVPGLDAEIRRLEEIRLEAVELRIDAELAAGQHAELVAEVEALAEEHPTRERFRFQHMLALYRSGRQADALRAYRRTETYLAEALGVDPSPELRDLELRILEQDGSLLGGVSREVTQRLAFLVTDIEGSTGLWDRHPDSMATTLATHDLILSEEVQRSGGRVFKHTGDGVLAVFTDALSAVAAAEAVLSRLAAVDWGDIGELRVRVGIDVGEAEARGEDFFGPPINRAARLCAVAHGGQVLVSSAAERDITATAPAGLQVRHLGEIHLRGMATPERVAQMVFVGLPADFPDLRVDTTSAIDDRVEVMSLPGYEVRERIGEGAFGVVWRAYQPSVGRQVAVKMIRPDLACQPQFARRFEAEARTIARLAHPHIVPLIDFWRDTTCAYLVLGLLQGGSLADELRRRPVDPGAARRILTQVGSALDHAHSQGVAHGDLKPANVLLDGAGNAYLSDFGIAARLMDPQELRSVSSAPEFRAPEVGATGPSPAADLFALGMLAAELLGDSDRQVAPIMRATAPNPDDRYPSAAALLADVGPFLELDEEESNLFSATRNPYKGLRPFDEADAADFYGRDDLIATLLEAVNRHPFVAVVGPSGSGKSSVVRSGLIPALLAGATYGSHEWLPVVFTPGRNPVDSLLQALTRVGGSAPDVHDSDPADLRAWADDAVVDAELLLVIDQFEELYTMTDDPTPRRRFFDLLLGVLSNPGRFHVVATLRADFYDRPLTDPRIGGLIRDGQVTVLPPSREELIEMVAGPAHAVGLRWEPGLPHRIAEDVAHQPGGLPLLQYALTELVERRSGDLLTASDYERIGEVAGALAKRAEAVLQNLTAAQQEAARQVLLRLVTVDEDSEYTRRRVRRTELESLEVSHADLQSVIDTFLAERLLLADRDPVAHTPTIEVAHEALLREWPRLRRWIDEQREAMILGRRLRAALSDWEANRHDDDYLLTGSRLAPFVGWAEATPLTPEEREFLSLSRARDERERLARRRRRRTLTGVLASAAVIAVVLGSVAGVQARRATAEASAARAAEQTAERSADEAGAAAALAEAESERARANELSAFATAALQFDPTLARLLAVASAQISDPSLDGISVLHQAFAADPVTDRYVWPEGRDVGFLWTALSSDGTRLVAGGCGCVEPSTYMEVLDLDTGAVLWNWDEVDNRSIIVDSPTFSPDGQTVVAGLYWHGESEATGGPLGAHIWDAETGDLLDHIDLGRCGGTVFAVSSTHILTDTVVNDDGGCFYPNMAAPGISLIELESRAQRLLTPTGGFVAMSRDGRYVAYGDRSVSPWRTVVEDVSSGERILELPVDSDQRVRALNHDGSLLVLSVEDRLEVWDVRRAEKVTDFFGHTAGVWSVRFSTGDDGSIYSTGRTGALLHWDSATGRQIAAFPAVGNGNVSMADNGLLAVADQTARTAALIDTRPRGEIWATQATSCDDGFVLAATMGIGGEYAAFGEHCPAAGEANTVVVGLAEQEVVNVVEGGREQATAISPDGTRFARVDVGDGPVASGNEEWFGPLRIRDSRTGEVIVEMEGLCTWDLSRGSDGTDQEGCAAYPATPFPMIASVIFWSGDGQRIAVGNPLTKLLTFWDASSGELISGYDGCRLPSGLYYDSGEVLVYCDEEEYARIVFVDEASGEESRSIEIERVATGDMAFTGYTPDRSSLVALTGFFGVGGGSLVWFDAETFEADVLERIHEGAPKSFATSPSGGLLATGASDGSVKVWDVVERREVHAFDIGETEVQGLGFLDESHLAVLTQTGLLSVYTLDVDELVRLVAESVSRQFTQIECERYGFGDQCPTLQELGGHPGHPRHPDDSPYSLVGEAP